ncbi:MAG: winged helix DNA-binding domain-containing protein [Oscillospiraceae bacterium]|nr:winged helix DNA-binding domain-containing protein [Oscillospiraceae bacterium]
MMMLSKQELKQIQLSRQHLTAKSDKITVCHDLNGFQAQIMVNVFHSLKIRCNEGIIIDNFGDGLVKNWTIRGTIHAFAAADLVLFRYQRKMDNNPYRSDDFKGYAHRITGQWLLTPERQRHFSRIIINSLKEGSRTRDELKKICLQHGITEIELDMMFEQWGGGIQDLCLRGFIYYVVQEKKTFALCSPFVPMTEDEAILEQVKRYFTHYAPATIRDAAYYFGCTQTYIKEIMKKLPLTQIEIDGKSYFYLEELKSDYPDIPHCIMLAGFDPLMLGYQKNDSIYLPQKYIRGIFNLAGIVMPPILLDGVVAGRWRKKNTKMTFEMFEDISAQNKKHIESAMEETFNDIRKTEWALV